MCSLEVFFLTSLAFFFYGKSTQIFTIKCMIQITKLSTPIFYFFTFVIIFSTVFSSVISQAKSDEIQVNKRDKKELTSALDKVNKVDPVKPEKSKLSQQQGNKDLFNSNQGNLNIDFDLKTKKVNLKNQLKGDTVINIPNPGDIDSVDIVGDTIIYSGKNSKVDTIIEPISGGFRQIINIKSADAPSFYDFPVDLGEGEKLILNEDGSVVITKADGKNKLYIPKPWAKDVSGKNLNTYYQISGSNLKQIIDLKDANYPVLADPLWCGDFFNSVYWENRNAEGGWTLRSFPTWCGRNYDTGYGFDEIINKSPSRDDLWPSYNKNYTSNQGRSMYNQYRCHVYFASLWKESYNLEPWRPLVTWSQMINPYDSRNNSVCNPK
jgi:hypothetical protein